MTTVDSKQSLIGAAGEHLACMDLLMTGHNAHLASQTCAYDLAVSFQGQLLRVQVKTTEKPRPVPQRVQRSEAYLWHTRRAGRGGKRYYEADAFDFLALVALDVRRVAYLPPGYRANTISILKPGQTGYGGQGKHFDDFPFEKAAECAIRKEVVPDVREYVESDRG